MDRIPALLGLKLDDEQLALFRQMVRFAISGGLLTIGVAGAYWAVADLLGVEPMVSMTIVYLCFTGVGYLIHSRWSFKDHGSRDQAHIRTVRFFHGQHAGFFSRTSSLCGGW